LLLHISSAITRRMHNIDFRLPSLPTTRLFLSLPPPSFDQHVDKRCHPRVNSPPLGYLTDLQAQDSRRHRRTHQTTSTHTPVRQRQQHSNTMASSQKPALVVLWFILKPLRYKDIHVIRPDPDIQSRSAGCLHVWDNIQCQLKN
jgi:hypothetical protein